MLTALGQGHGSDALGALDAGVGLLILVLHVVEHDVVASWVNNLVVVQEEDVVCNVRFQSGNEL